MTTQDCWELRSRAMTDRLREAVRVVISDLDVVQNDLRTALAATGDSDPMLGTVRDGRHPDHYCGQEPCPHIPATGDSEGPPERFDRSWWHYADDCPARPGDSEGSGLDVDVLWGVLAGIGVIDNGTWVAFTKDDATAIAEAYAAEYARLSSGDVPKENRS